MLVFLNCYDICMCVMNKQFDLLEFVFDSVFPSILLLGLCPCVVPVLIWSSFVCRGTLCGCGGCYECDACTVVCVAYAYAERV